jgi:hypothetical protein
MIWQVDKTAKRQLLYLTNLISFILKAKCKNKGPKMGVRKPTHLTSGNICTNICKSRQCSTIRQ